jgi:hypothetical protein
MADHDDRHRTPHGTPLLKRLAEAKKEAERLRVLDALEATFPAVATASSDELVQMAIHALHFDGPRLAASLGVARSEGEALIRSPGSISRRQRALLAQYLEMGGNPATAERNRSIAAKLRASIAEADRKNEADRRAADTR